MKTYTEFLVEMKDSTGELYSLNLHNNIETVDVPFNRRGGQRSNVKGVYVMGAVDMKGKSFGLLNVNTWDYEWAKTEGLTLKKGEYLARVDNSLSKVVKGHLQNASLVKFNVLTATITFLKDYEAEHPVWAKAVRVRRITIHEPFIKRID